MADVLLAECTSRMQADLTVEVLRAAGVHAVAFEDVTRGASGEVLASFATVRVLAGDLDRAREVLAAWAADAAEPVDPDELERQALACARAAGPDTRPGVAARADEARPPPPSTACPHCRATPAPRGPLARALGAVLRRASRPRERLCAACGHRWTDAPTG